MSWNLGLQVNNLVAEVNKLTAVSLTNPVVNNIGLSNNNLTNCSSISSSDETPLNLDANNTPPTIPINNSATINGSLVINNTANQNGLLTTDTGGTNGTFVDSSGGLGVNQNSPFTVSNYDMVTTPGSLINGKVFASSYQIVNPSGSAIISRAQASNNTYVKMDFDMRTQLSATNFTPTVTELNVNGDLYCTDFQGTLNPPLPDPYNTIVLLYTDKIALPYGVPPATSYTPIFNLQPNTTYILLWQFDFGGPFYNSNPAYQLTWQGVLYLKSNVASINNQCQGVTYMNYSIGQGFRPGATSDTGSFVIQTDSTPNPTVQLALQPGFAYTTSDYFRRTFYLMSP